MFGHLRVLDEESDKRAAIEKLAIKYAPNDSAANRKKAIEDEWNPLCMLEMAIAHMSGKAALELMKHDK